jgi:hypothetical protein
MEANTVRTKEQVIKANVRFVVGAKKGTYVNGRSKMAVPTLDLKQATATLDYYDQMAVGETVAFELVPIEINSDGTISRKT